ncbi:MAG: hypothetical protein AAFZ15_30230 [Bacteroidota bacterium]
MEEKKINEKLSSPKPLTRFDRSDWLSILAVVVSSIALAVSIYETGILKEQSSMMQAQQKASVWPYLEMVGSYIYDEKVTVSFAFENKGVGPARIESFKILIDGEEYADYAALYKFFKKSLSKEAPPGFSLNKLSGVRAWTKIKSAKNDTFNEGAPKVG